jgi:hypothetical protein
MLTSSQRAATIADLDQLRRKYRKLDMPAEVIQELASPPRNPEDCIFARTTETISADLHTKITPCQFGGDPDCTQCGCIASMGLAAVGHHRVAGPITAGQLFMASDRIGKLWRKLQRRLLGKPPIGSVPSPFNILVPEVSKPERAPLIRQP